MFVRACIPSGPKCFEMEVAFEMGRRCWRVLNVTDDVFGVLR